uniref:DUF659 domain-containing protein n=1 Tax=Cajanus cajan TaxID=3821 RepID=A0A151R3N5_CAJCA|nr:hypothetical protein KK1_041673 [Cajanus cajan]
MTNLSSDDHRTYWKKLGCTIMTNGWTDRRRRTILDFLVNSPLGTIFLNFINASKMTVASDRRITSYIYDRISLIALLNKFSKGTLTGLFTSKEWTSSQLAKTEDEKFMENLVIDKEFWKNILNCMKNTFSLVKVLLSVDSNEKLVMKFIYEEID